MTDGRELGAARHRLGVKAKRDIGQSSICETADLAMVLAALSASEAENARLRQLDRYASHGVGCALYQRSWASGEPPCTCGLDEVRAALTASPAPEKGEREAPKAMVRITREQYPEIIQAVRWSDEDNGTPHFEPGVGFIVDDPDGLAVPIRWVQYLGTIEGALAGLDHVNPHPLDVDTLEYLARDGKPATVEDSAAACFVRGEHTPMTAMAESSRELWIASRFLNEYFEGWHFDPGSGFDAILALRNPTSEQGGADD